MKSRLLWCDILRVIATIMVISIHTISVYQYTYIKPLQLLPYSIFGILNSLNRMAVPAFFMLTGALTLKQTKKPITRVSYTYFIKNIIYRLVIPFIIFSLVSYLFFTKPPWSITKFIVSFSNYPGTYGHMWFMYVIIMIYFFIPFLRRFVQSLSRHELKLLICLIFIFSNVLSELFILARYYHKTLFSGVALPYIIAYANLLLLGFYFTKYNISLAKKKLIYMLGVISLVSLPILQALTNDITEDLVTGRSILPVFISSAGFIFIKYHFSKVKLSSCVTKVITKLSEISFYTYLVHMVIINIFYTYLLNHNYLNTWTDQLIWAPIQIIVVFIVSSIIAYLFDKLYRYLTKKSSALITRHQPAKQLGNSS